MVEQDPGEESGVQFLRQLRSSGEITRRQEPPLSKQSLTLFVAVRYREYRKFLAGAFFVCSGMQFYFYPAKVPIQLRSTRLRELVGRLGRMGRSSSNFFPSSPRNAALGG
jgi:hypothetical protein